MDLNENKAGMQPDTVPIKDLGAEKHQHHDTQHHMHNTEGKQKKKINLWMVSAAILVVLLAVSLFTGGFGLTGNKGISKEAAAEKALSFVTENLLQGQATAEITSVIEEGDLYSINLVVNGQQYDSYVTKDGKTFFPQGIDMEEFAAKAAATETASPTAAATAVVKSDKPVVELFVMSHCPYGTQIEKGILPVVKLLGEKIDFQLKFVYYAMHGETEVMEELNQYCIQKEQKEKLFDYLKCFLAEGNGESCLAEAKIDTAKLKACTEAADEEFSVSKNLNDQTTWLSGKFPKVDFYKADNEKYDVGGSPTFIINGENVNSGRDSVSLLSAVCDAFNVAPAECETKLETASPSPGFGWSTTENKNIASCGG